MKFELDEDKKIYAYVRTATGEDDKYIYAIRAKLEAALPDRGASGSEMLVQDQFASCMVCTERLEGMTFPLCSADDPQETLAAVYLAWLKLPRRMLRAWKHAPDTLDDNFNAADLLPPHMVDEATRKSPLPQQGEKSSR